MNRSKTHRLPGGSPNKNPKKLNTAASKKEPKVMTAGRIILLAFLSLVFLLFLSVHLFLTFYRPSVPAPSLTIKDPGGFGEEFLSDLNDEGKAPFEDMSGEWNSDCFTFLIAGLDKGSGTTDTMMVAMFNVKDNTVSILNVPRDTYVTTKNHSGKINGVYSQGRKIAKNAGYSDEDISAKGMSYLKEMINYTFGIPIHKYVLINLQGFKELVNKIGGVYFDVPIRMYYTDPEQGLYIDLQPGYQLLNGDKSEQLIRFRQNNDGTGYARYINGEYYPDADIGRIKTQQHFIAALLKKMINPLDINNIKSLFEVGSKYMVTDINAADMVWFAQKMTNVKLENMRTHTLPGYWISPRYEIYSRESIEIINKYYNPYKKDIPESNFNIYDKTIVNAPGKPEIDIDGSVLSEMIK